MSQTIDRTATAPRVDSDAPTVAMRRPVGTVGPVGMPGPVRPAPAFVAGPRHAPAARAPHAAYAAPHAPVGPARPGPRWGRVATVAAAGVGAVAVLGSLAVANHTTDVSGSVTVKGMSGYVAVGQSCVPTSSATQRTVSLFDGSGDLVGVADLPASGTAVSTGSSYSSSYGYADACRYDMTPSDVRLADDFYRVSLGSDASSGVSFTREQIVDRGVHTTWGL